MTVTRPGLWQKTVLVKVQSPLCVVRGAGIFFIYVISVL